MPHCPFSLQLHNRIYRGHLICQTNLFTSDKTRKNLTLAFLSGQDKAVLQQSIALAETFFDLSCTGEADFVLRLSCPVRHD